MKSVLTAGGLLDEVRPTDPRASADIPGSEAWGSIDGRFFVAWKQSSVINELCLLPDLIIEGNWENDPLRARRVILDYLSHHTCRHMVEPGFIHLCDQTTQSRFPATGGRL